MPMFCIHKAKAGAALALAACLALPGAAQAASAPPPAPTYADLADLADSATLVLRAKVSGMKRVEPARAPGVRPGWGRFYVTAKTQALLIGSAAMSEKLRYLADFPLDSRGKPPALGKAPVLIFANPVPSRPGELQLVAPDAQVRWSQGSEAMLREILYELIAPDTPSRITGVREAIHVPGTLRGEGETQIFLSTADSSAASLTVNHRAGSPPQWGASFSEVLASVGPPPPQNTLLWYRLACFLPAAMPPGANLSESPATREQADADYRMVVRDLGSCPRTRG